MELAPQSTAEFDGFIAKESAANGLTADALPSQVLTSLDTPPNAAMPLARPTCQRSIGVLKPPLDFQDRRVVTQGPTQCLSFGELHIAHSS